MILRVFFCTVCIIITTTTYCQSVATFSSVTPGPQTQNLVLPSTHTFQRIIKSGDALTAGGTLGDNLDFTGYVPISGSSTNGYLSISSETTPAKVAILNISFNAATKNWNTSGSGAVFFSIGNATSHLGNVGRFCSGTVTPDNTIMVCEETTVAGNANTSVDSYQDLGWVIEIDPATRTVKDYNADGIADKLWAVGRQAHENVSIRSDRTVIYWGADNGGLSYMYKFIPTIPGNYTAGLLYVLETTSSLVTGTWLQVPNSTVTDRNNTVPVSTALGAYSFDGIEDVEIGPDGKIYFAAKGPGRIYRFTDNGNTVAGLEVFVENTNYDVDPGPAVLNEAWGIGNDNLAFDGEGNLWVLQDGDRNHIWVVASTHTASAPAVRLFAKTPVGSEPTGITFSPDYQFMFLSFQHPSGGNTTPQTDAAGVSVIFNTSTTVVVARKENLGCPGLPLLKKRSVASGAWNISTTWECGLPGINDSVEISPGHLIMLPANAQVKHLKILPGGALTINTMVTITIGAETDKTSAAIVSGSLNISNGSLTIFGKLSLENNYHFSQTGGTVKIDGNTGVNGTSIANGQHLFSAPATTGTFNLLGGTLQIVNPPLGANSEALSSFYNFGFASILKFGDGISFIQSDNINGFGGASFPSSIGQLILDATTVNNNRILKVVKPLTVYTRCDVISGNLIQQAELKVQLP